jgi:hypothetical protein
MEQHLVYVITFDDCVYVGRTNDIKRRMSEHGYPPDWFILEFTTKEEVLGCEGKWAKYFSEELGVELLNIADDFSEGILNHSEETKKYLSKLQKGIPKPKQSEAMKQVWQTPEYRALMKLRPKPSNLFQPGQPSPRKGGHREDLTQEGLESIREHGKRTTEYNRKTWKDPEVRRKRIEGISKANKGHIPYNKTPQYVEDRIIELHKQGRSKKEIMSILGVGDNTVYDILVRTGNHIPKKRKIR